MSSRVTVPGRTVEIFELDVGGNLATIAEGMRQTEVSRNIARDICYESVTAGLLLWTYLAVIRL